MRGNAIGRTFGTAFRLGLGAATWIALTVGAGQNLDADYLARLIEQIRSIPGHGHYHILAFEWR